ncbi:MAG: sulfatase-like hydrolase/transferase [Treponema sp.]|nr:sulfatase-like hydrolase/transferase [Treponema sp.]
MKKQRYLHIIGTALIAGLSAAPLHVGAQENTPDALPPNPRNYTRDMGSGNPLALAKLASARGYNVLFITSDEHNAQMIGYEGNTDILTPNLDKLAREGEYFTHAYDACPLCAPTRQSIYTGLYPVEHGQTNNNVVFQEQPTWADFFSAQGYYTAVIGKTHDNNPSQNFGFQYVVKNSGAGRSQLLAPPPGLPRNKMDPKDQALFNAPPADKRTVGHILQDPRQHQDGMVTQLAKEFLEKNKNKKFFLHASLIAPHWPWNSPSKFYYMYDPAKIKMPANLGPPEDFQPLNIYTNANWDQLTEEQYRMFRARYMGMMSWMDDDVGQIIQKLDDLGLKDKTLVIYSSDHGDMAAEKGMWFKMVMYEQSARVPLIIRMPGIIEPGTKNDTLINHVDYFPTIAGLTGNGAAIPADLTGVDLTAAVLGLTKGPDYTFTLSNTANKGQVPRVQMVRSAQYKLVRYLGGKDREYTLYDITNDPYEDHNLINDPEYQGIIDTHKKVLADFMASLRYSKLPFVRLNGASDD